MVFLNLFMFVYWIGFKVIVDSKALLALVGTEMDYVEDDLRAEFVFNNPNSKVNTNVVYIF